MGQIKKLASAFVTPKDTTDINQLVSLLQGLENCLPHQQFKVGQRALIWLNINQYCTHIDCNSTWSHYSEVISVNELARQLAMT